jgi:hypothetical protein
MRKLGISLVGLIFLVSCAGISNFLSGDNPVAQFSNLPPKQKLTVAMDLYSRVYDDTQRILTDPTSTPEQKKLAAEKVKILVKYNQAISIYKLFVDAGTTPGPDDEEALINFVNELVKKGVNL